LPVVYQVDNGADKAKASGKNIQNAHSDLVGKETMNSGNSQEADQSCKQDDLRISSPPRYILAKL
jgi:hypothetical protein